LNTASKTPAHGGRPLTGRADGEGTECTREPASLALAPRRDVKAAASRPTQRARRRTLACHHPPTSRAVYPDARARTHRPTRRADFSPVVLARVSADGHGPTADKGSE